MVFKKEAREEIRLLHCRIGEDHDSLDYGSGVKMNNIFLNIRDFSLLKELIELEDIHKSFKIVGISTNSIEKVNMLLELNTDFLIIQHEIDVSKSLAMLDFITTHEQFNKINVIMLFEELTNDSIHSLMHNNINTFLVKPYDAKQLVDAIQSQSNKQETQNYNHSRIENMAYDCMIKLGIPTHLLGFSYIRSASIMIAQDSKSKRFLMLDVYKEVAQLHHTTATRVEKCMRTAVNFAYRNQPERICIHHTKPTSSQIIIYISEGLKLLKLA